MQRWCDLSNPILPLHSLPTNPCLQHNPPSPQNEHFPSFFPHWYQHCAPTFFTGWAIIEFLGLEKPQLKFWLCIGNTWFYTDLQVFTVRPTISTSISVPVAISCFPIEGTAWVLFQFVNRNTSDTKQIFASYFALFLSGHWRICDASRSSNSKFWAIKVKLNITSKSFKRPKWPETIEPPYRTLRTF